MTIKTLKNLMPITLCKNISFTKMLSLCVLSFSFIALIALSSSISRAQEKSSEMTIEDYMESNEPAQVDLESSQSEVPEKQEDSVLSKIQEKLESFSKSDEEEVESQDDVLPNIQTRRVSIDTPGFENATSRRISVDIESDFEQTQEELEEEIRREAFDAAITGLFPLEDEQIRHLLRRYEATRRVVKEPVHGVPTPRVNVSTVSLDPGVPPMVIQTAVGHVTTLNILDITGAPWPVQDISWAGDFEVTEPEQGGHIIRIVPLEYAAYGNMSIRLLTLKTPVTIMLKTSKDEVQYRVDARIPEYGPFAEASLIQGGSEMVAGNELITSVLDGVFPANATRLSVSGVDGRTSAFNSNGLTYVRTPLTLLSPGWEQSVSSADGMNVYALNQTPIVLLSDNGRFMRVSLTPAQDLN